MVERYVFFGLGPLELLYVYIQMPLHQLVCLQVHINQLQYLRHLLSTKSHMTKNRQHVILNVILYINTVQYNKLLALNSDEGSCGRGSLQWLNCLVCQKKTVSLMHQLQVCLNHKWL